MDKPDAPVVKVSQAPSRIQGNFNGSPYGEHLGTFKGICQGASAHQLGHQDVRFLLGASAQELQWHEQQQISKNGTALQGARIARNHYSREKPRSFLSTWTALG
jgi:hypothetical protein